MVNDSLPKNIGLHVCEKFRQISRGLPDKVLRQNFRQKCLSTYHCFKYIERIHPAVYDKL